MTHKTSRSRNVLSIEHTASAVSVVFWLVCRLEKGNITYFIPTFKESSNFAPLNERSFKRNTTVFN